MQRALKKGGALGHLRHFVVDDQRGGTIDPLHRFHRIGAEVGRAPRLAIAFAAGLGAIDAPPIGESLGLESVRVKRKIGGKRVVGRHGRQREAFADIRVLDRRAAAHRDATKHGKPLDIQQRVAGNMRARIEPHVTDVFGKAAGDLGGAHIASGGGGTARPFMREVVGLRAARMLHHDDHREVDASVRRRRRASLAPEFGRCRRNSHP